MRSLPGVMFDCVIEREFELQSAYNVHFQTNSCGKPVIPPVY